VDEREERDPILTSAVITQKQRVFALFVIKLIVGWQGGKIA
jgi:hypothetical protein